VLTGIGFDDNLLLIDPKIIYRCLLELKNPIIAKIPPYNS